MTAPDADGWIEWSGGEPPISKGTEHRIKYRDGVESVQNGKGWGDKVWAFYWKHAGNCDDIVRYRIVEPRP